MVTLGTYFDNRQQSDKNFGIIKIVVFVNRKPKMVSTKIKLLKSDWEKIKRNIINGKLSAKIVDTNLINAYNLIFGENSYFKKAENIVESLKNNFNFVEFKMLFEKDNSVNIVNNTQNELFSSIEDKVKYLWENEQIESARVFGNAAESLKRFCKKDKLFYKEINPEFLKKYEKWMLKSGKISPGGKRKNMPASITTVAIYLKCVRIILGEAKDNKVILPDDYPFGGKKYNIPDANKTKKALMKSQVLQIKSIDTLPPHQELAKDLWLFSYLCNGMNFTDICRLKKDNLSNDEFQFLRKKTRNSRKEQKIIRVKLLPEAKAIIEKYQIENSEYVFPFLSSSMNEEEKLKKIRNLIRNTNLNLNKLLKKMGFTQKVNTYHARHSFATILLRSNAPIKFIQDSLGHAKLETTENYLASFEDDQIKHYMNSLL